MSIATDRIRITKIDWNTGHLTEAMGWAKTQGIAVRDWAGKQARAAYKAIALRSLESSLSDIITIANGHQKKGIAKHAQVYSVLWSKADALIIAFSERHAVDRSELYAQMPALAELEDWASPAPASSSPSVRFAAALVGFGFIPVIMGCATGLFQSMFGWGHQLVHHLF
jgi:hypothetical protein